MKTPKLPVYDGTENCRWCDRTPPKDQPKTAVHVGSTVWSEACMDCALDRDNLVHPREAR